MEDTELDLWQNLTEAAVQLAQTVRETHRNRSSKKDMVRNSDIGHARTRLRTVMKPIRSELSKISKQIEDARAEHDSVLAGRLSVQRTRLHGLSDDLQRERRKLWKMSNRRKASGSRKKAHRN